ncbi:hypothetical protein [Natrarchaeobaculum sulfurireducens]|nr:hypothetical protein [Natrarchaeobaculum sulfurireducens]
MIDSVPLHVEVMIYLYFALVASVGGYLLARLWLASRRTDEVGDGINPN